MANAGKRFYKGLLEQAIKLGGMVRITLVDEGIALVQNEDDIPKPEFDTACRMLEDGDKAIIVHIDSAQFFTQNDWIKLKEAGAETIVINREPNQQG